jgi:hypothetical protein
MLDGDLADPFAWMETLFLLISSPVCCDGCNHPFYQFQDKFGPPSGGSSRAMETPSSSARYEPSRDYGRGGNDSYAYGSGGSSNYRGGREEAGRGGRDRYGHDAYNGSGSSGHFRDDINMADVPSGPAAESGAQIYIRNVSQTYLVFGYLMMDPRPNIQIL